METCGKRIPASEHAVSMQLPRMRDVIGYEEQQPEVLRHICSGYPRFVCHWMVQRVQEHLGAGREGGVIALRDEPAVSQLMRRCGPGLEPIGGLPFGAVQLSRAASGEERVAIQRFLQHTGLGLSSREAEDHLIGLGEPLVRQAEVQDEADAPEAVVKGILADAYQVHPGRIQLYPSGMSAYYSVFDAWERIQTPKGRTTWLQVGWLYLDTGALLQKYAQHTEIFGVQELDRLERYLEQNGASVAALTTEVMTNPLLETPDLERLAQLARRHDIPLLVDTSMPTPYNVDVTPYADVIIESLTKFASGQADVMMGAAVFGKDSASADEICRNQEASRPYERDLRRMAHNIQGYRQRMETVNASAQELSRYLGAHPRVRQVLGAGQSGSREAYEAIRRPEGGYGGVLSVVFRSPLEAVYDALPLLKGPSFGTTFTLCMPYVYLAHYDLVRTPEGRRELLRHGVEPELLRISVGTEPTEDILEAFASVLDG